MKFNQLIFFLFFIFCFWCDNVLAYCYSSAAGKYCLTSDTYTCPVGCYCNGASEPDGALDKHGNGKSDIRNKNVVAWCNSGTSCVWSAGVGQCGTSDNAKIFRCPANYPNSPAGSTNVCDCYLQLQAGKYVPTEKGGMQYCPKGYYCPKSSGTVAYTKCAGEGNGTKGPNQVRDPMAVTITPTEGYWITSGYLVPCDQGKYNPNTGATSSSACKSCSAGYYASGTGNTSCSVCGVGTYSNSGAASCTACQAGYYNDATGKSSCTACPAGKYASGTGNTSCAVCSAGTYSNSGASSCTACPAGKYSSGTGNTTCTACSNGTFASGTGNSSCTACPALTSGYSYTSGEGWASASSCKEEKQASAVSENCYSGSLTKTGKNATEWNGATSTLKAKAGYEVTGSGDSMTCTMCEAGKYSETGWTECAACPEGKVSNSTRTGCISCDEADEYKEGGECKKCPEKPSLYKYVKIDGENTDRNGIKSCMIKLSSTDSECDVDKSNVTWVATNDGVWTKKNTDAVAKKTSYVKNPLPTTTESDFCGICPTVDGYPTFNLGKSKNGVDACQKCASGRCLDYNSNSGKWDCVTLAGQNLKQYVVTKDQENVKCSDIKPNSVYSCDDGIVSEYNSVCTKCSSGYVLNDSKTGCIVQRLKFKVSTGSSWRWPEFLKLNKINSNVIKN